MNRPKLVGEAIIVMFDRYQPAMLIIPYAYIHYGNDWCKTPPCGYSRIFNDGRKVQFRNHLSNRRSETLSVIELNSNLFYCG